MTTSTMFSIGLLLLALAHHSTCDFFSGGVRPMIISSSDLPLNEASFSSPTTIKDVDDAAFASVGQLHRSDRAVPAIITVSGTDSNDSGFANGRANIQSKINHLNDSLSQLMVHWLTDDVMICLAREPTPGSAKPSGMYISYDYGDSFVDQTLLFTVPVDRKDVNGKQMNSTLDQFVINPKYNTIVFLDSRNKAIFTNSDSGKTFKRHMLDFTPSEVFFYETDTRTFLILDKVDVDRKLYYTTDFGETFDLLQRNVTAVMWSSPGGELPTQLYVVRNESASKPGSLSVAFINTLDLLVPNKIPTFKALMDDVQEFSMQKDFMFATRTVQNFKHLFVSYKRGNFVKAHFETHYTIHGLHIADVDGARLMVTVVHSEVTCSLYVSEEAHETMSELRFAQSLENVFAYVPGESWKNNWLSRVTDKPFIDLHKVEGFRDIYIASEELDTHYDRTTPEFLRSLISYDHGVSWHPIQAPTVDHEGQLMNCTNCSLHLAQQFMQLYPVTPWTPIRSSKWAPGVIMATGFVGTSMRGTAALYLSRDAGQTWQQIRQNHHHYFNFGDHGGMLVTVKLHKTTGEADNELLYSIDDGVNWTPYRFRSTDLTVYGLMTDAVTNYNSTVFTLFGTEGSGNSEHPRRWLIVKVDLKNAFEHKCSAHDYTSWSTGKCELGAQKTFQRRAADAKCYSGKSYEGPVRSEVCECGRFDFECDTGFSRQNPKEPCKPILNLALSDLYEVPASCAPNEFYNQTRGYRLISSNVCVHGESSQFLPQVVPCPFAPGNDFLVVAQRDKISRIDIASGKKEVLPVEGLENAIAIEFDIRQNCVFWADILTDSIGRQCFNGNQSRETLLETDLASVEGLSYDWISELLYFVDGTRLQIEAITTSEQRYGRVGMRKTIIEKQHLLKPRGIVVHPPEGYLFWTDWSPTDPAIMRSNLDGTDIRQLFTKPQIVWPNGITIDYITNRVYWVDLGRNFIASCELNGNSLRTILGQEWRIVLPMAVVVHNDHLFWDDWKMNSVFSADKNRENVVRTLAEHMPSLMDLKFYSHSIQTGSSACSSATGVTHNCSHICVTGPHKTYSCLCLDGLELSASGECVCPGSHQPFANKKCPQLGNTCPPNFFECANQKRVSSIYMCDGKNDCRDNSDELNCSTVVQCPPPMFACAADADNKCIPEYFRCNHLKDCADGSDELQCNLTADCRDGEFKCNDGSCIDQKWKCDSDIDCSDGSDEMGCGEQPQPVPLTCRPGEFPCDNGRCFMMSWRCDNDVDCEDGSDERDCPLVMLMRYNFWSNRRSER